MFGLPYDEYIRLWKLGEVTGHRGKTNISRHVHRYMRLTYGDRCSRCGWCEKHPITGEVPVELHHIDGDFSKTVESNLELLCPNCHSLTHTYRGRNRGNGRPQRMPS